MNDHADVELFIRRVGERDDIRTYQASYEDMAHQHTRTAVESIDLSDVGRGKYEVGIRERGDEQHTQHVEITPLMESSGDAAIVFKNQAMAVMEHWRQ